MSFTPIPQRIEAHIRNAIAAAQAAEDLPNSDQEFTIPINRPKKADQSDFASPAALAMAKALRMKPLDIANAIAKNMPIIDFVERVEVAPPGYLNFWLDKSWLRAQVEAIIQTGDEVFGLAIGAGKRVNVEFVSANPTGPLHIGRTRGAVVGDCLARLLEACGYDVFREYYFNNGGRQMMMLGKSLQVRYLNALGEKAELPEDGYQGEYLIDMAKEIVEQHGEAWKQRDWQPFKEYAEQQIFKSIEATLKRIGIKFDLFFRELSLYGEPIEKVTQQLRDKGYLYEAVTREGASEEEIAKAAREKHEAATWFKSTAFGDNEDRVVLRSSGEPTYVMPDIAYHVNKLERGFDRCIDVFGSDHFTEAQTVNRGIQALGLDADKIDVVVTQWVHILRDGQAVSGSTRKGQILALDDLLDEIGPDAVRYFMLNRSTDQTINFDLELALKQSNENPVYYIQNAHVRCCGILRQLEERGYPADWDDGADLSQLSDDEMTFVLKMLELPEVIQFAHDSLAPHQIAFWAIDLARIFHPMYDNYRVLHSEVPEEVAKARLRLYRAAQIVFKRILTLMGMSAPERM